MAVDWISKILYWVEHSSGHDAIMACTTKGKYKKTLFNSDLRRPRDLVVDPIRG